MEMTPNNYSTAALAYLGDCVLELLVRERLTLSGISSSKSLNKEALKFVSAPAQAAAMKNILELLTEEEFNDSNTDAGELGSGHTVTVVYEIKMKNDGVFKAEALLPIANVIIKYKPSENVGGDATEERELNLAVLNSDYKENPTDQDLFIASVVEFGLILRDSEYKADANLSSLISRLATLDLENDEFKAEFRELVNKYESNVNKQ